MAKQRLSLYMLVLLSAVLCLPAQGAQVARVQITPSQIQFEPQVSYERLVLTVSTPGGNVIRREFAAGQAPLFELAKGVADGAYVYELRVAPQIDSETRRALAAARESGNAAAIQRLQKSGKLPAGELVQSGFFSVAGGAIVAPDQREERPARQASAAKAGPAGLPTKDNVIADDEIVQGSLCVGLDCVANESFGFDTIRLKENNTRIKFEDTSTGAGFPTDDWQLTANDSASGGSNRFSIEDITTATVPFTVTGGAPTNSVFVDATGRVGLGTSTPVLQLHETRSDTPAIRLEQTNAGGFTAQTWDIGANEANFFVRDVTGGSRLPFRIRPGAPTSSIDISAAGKVGIGTASPSTKLHVTGSDGTTKMFVEETSGTSAGREMAEYRNNGQVVIVVKDSTQTPRWAYGNFGTSFIIDNQSNAGVEMTLSSTGSITIPGTITTGSDRYSKTDILDVRPEEILAKVSNLPISTWRYKNDTSQHLGPMAQDFAAAFGLGADDKHISPLDAAGVSLAAVQALYQEVTQKQAAIDELQKRNADLEKRLADLEAVVSKLAPIQK